MNLDFLNDYWINNINANKHFEKLNVELINSVGSRGIPEDRLKTMYKGFKRWDLHFPEKRIAIEYKTLSTDAKQETLQKYLKRHPNRGPHYTNLRRNAGLRLEEALGCSKDVKDLHKDYKLGYIFVISFDKKQKYEPAEKTINWLISSFDKMIQNKVYDFFCPLITFGIDDHKELSENYTCNKFVEEIKNSPAIEISPFAEFFA